MSAAVVSNNRAPSPSVESYYTSLESRLGYRLLLGNARHCGLWPKGKLWPFPISKAQRAMEEKMYDRLDLKNDSQVLDAGAGSGIVAAYMAERGLRVKAIDLTPLHVAEAKRNIKARGLEQQVSVELGDYHDLSSIDDNSLDGIYTMEAFVHADDPFGVLWNFRRTLKEGGVLVMHEADFNSNSELLQEVLRLSHCQNTLENGSYGNLLKDAGFKSITVEDLTDNVLPLWRLFGLLGAIPYEIFRLLGVQHRFTNVMAGVEVYRHWGQGRYISIRAIKA